MLALKLAAAATLTATNGFFFLLLATAFNTFTYLIKKQKYIWLFLKKTKLNVLIFRWILCFLLNIFEQTSGDVFIYKAHERPLLLHFGAHLLILILFEAHKLLNRAYRHLLQNQQKWLMPSKLFGAWIISSGDCSATVVRFLSGRVKHWHCVFLSYRVTSDSWWVTLQCNRSFCRVHFHLQGKLKIRIAINLLYSTSCFPWRQQVEIHFT